MTYDNLNNNFKKAQLKKAQLKKAFSLIELSVVVLIIGILIAGITAGSRLVRNSKLASAAQLTKSSDVNSIPDLVLWLEPTIENSFAVADATININEDISTSSYGENTVYERLSNSKNSSYVPDVSRPDNRQYIARWNDINPRAVAGNKKSVYQPRHSRRPMYIDNAINGLPALWFDTKGSGNNNPDVIFLYSRNNQYTPSAPPLISNSKVGTYFIVFSMDFNKSGSSPELVSQWVGFNKQWNAGGEKKLFGISIDKAGSKKTFLHTWGNDTFTSDPIGVINDKVAVFSAVSLENKTVKATNNASICIKSNCGYATVDTDSYNGVADDTFTVGAISSQEIGEAGFNFNGYIGEVMVFDRALKTEEIDIVNKYLSKKWGIALK